MASRIIHLVITNELIKQHEFNDVDRLRLGTIIPDGAANREEYLPSHFKMKIGNENERTDDLTRYRTLRMINWQVLQKQVFLVSL